MALHFQQPQVSESSGVVSQGDSSANLLPQLCWRECALSGAMVVCCLVGPLCAPGGLVAEAGAGSDLLVQVHLFDHCTFLYLEFVNGVPLAGAILVLHQLGLVE